MSDDQEQAEDQQLEAGSEEAFFARIQSMMDASLSDERIGRAFDAWAASINAGLPEEEQAKPPKRRQGKEDEQDAEAERVESEGEPSGAERRRASGGVGPGSRSGYWNNARRWIYGRGR